ncbi:hypothetical protein C6501_09260 [Candidatus Poribacteria bacterium]|nr:MAG: hypothetical protein C6501_09260 [Candidatus Poribacteria bacterium]
MKLRIENLTTLLIFTVILFAGCSGCGQKTVEQEINTEQEGVDGHRHADGTWHPTPDTPIPSAPENDPFFDSIVFPDKPLLDEDGHYRPKNPFKIRDVVKNNPRLFRINEKGYKENILSKEMEKRWEDVRSEPNVLELSDEVYSRKLAEALSEGLAPLVGSIYLRAHGSTFLPEAKELVEEALAQNPNDFETLEHWAGMFRHDKPDEVETVYRRLLQMRPDDLRTLYKLGTFIVRNYDDPSEAIPYLEKAYKLKPDWAGPILFLGEVYFARREFEKSLRYLQAYQRFAGTHPGPAADYIAAIYTIFAKQNKGVAIQ